MSSAATAGRRPNAGPETDRHRRGAHRSGSRRHAAGVPRLARRQPLQRGYRPGPAGAGHGADGPAGRATRSAGSCATAPRPRVSTWPPRRTRPSRPRSPWSHWTPRGTRATTSTSTGRPTGSGPRRKRAGCPNPPRCCTSARSPPGPRPAATSILDLAQRMRDRGDVLVSYDPNVRPGLMGGHEHGQRIVERGIQAAHVAKASAEDIGWLYPGQDAEDVARHWHRLGVSLVVITDGGNGATAFTATGPPAAPPGARGEGGGHRGRRGLVHLRPAGRPGPAGQAHAVVAGQPARPRNCGPCWTTRSRCRRSPASGRAPARRRSPTSRPRAGARRQAVAE